MSRLGWVCLCAVLCVGCEDLRRPGEPEEPGSDSGPPGAGSGSDAGKDAGGTGGSDGGNAGRGGSNAGRGGSGAGRGGTSGGGSGSGGTAGGSNTTAGKGGSDDSEPMPFDVKNVPADLAMSADGDLILNTEACNSEPEIDSVTGMIGGCNPEKGELKFTFTAITQPDTALGTLTAGLIVTRRFVVEQGMRVTVKGNRPLIVVALESAQIDGHLQANAIQGEARGGGFGVTEGGQSGLGPGGGGKPNGRSGAGGAGYCGRGGAGGKALGLSALGGMSYGTPENVPLIGGSSGAMVHSYGSAGGGAIQISAGQRIEVSALGAIHVGGGGPAWSANGGGSGGAILLEAPEVRVLGRLAANGGGGSSPSSADSSKGADGSADDQPAVGGRVPDFPYGGDGAAASIIDGQAGGDLPDDNGGIGGGGGGAAGRIRINVAEGEPDLAGAIISPAIGTACFSVGTLNE